MKRMLSSIKAKRAGIAGAWLIVAFTALAGAAAMSFDLGRLAIAVQRCQDIADSAALAGATRLPYETPARNAALQTASANAAEGNGWPVEVTNADITFIGPNGTVDGYTLGPWAQGLKVTARASVDFSFSRIFGILGTEAERSCVVIRGPVEGIPICTMWIAHNTPLIYGEPMNMLMADGPHYANIPGSFGFLQEPPGCTADWFELLQGYGLTATDIETSFVNVGDSVFAETGLGVGNFKKALVDDHGRSRLERGLEVGGKWEHDTFTDHQPDNPRIMLVPLVTFLGGTGSNAEFRIEKFGAFWLEGINQGKKEIIGKFMEYDFPGGDPNSQLTYSSGIFATEMVR